MPNTMAYMVNFKYDYFDKPSPAIKEWLTSNHLHSIEGLLNISATADLLDVWMVIEAASESQLLNVIENLEYLAEYEYQYYLLEITSSVFNFARYKMNPEL